MLLTVYGIMRKNVKKYIKTELQVVTMKSGSSKYFLLISVSLIGAVVPSHNILTHDTLGQGPNVVKEQVSNILNTSDISSKLQISRILHRSLVHLYIRKPVIREWVP